MFPDPLKPLLRSAAFVVLLAGIPAAAFAAPQASSRPLILSTQRGVSDSQCGGTELQTGPVSRQPIFETPPMATPQELPANGSAPYPYVIAPYIEVPGVGLPHYPQPRPRPTPHSQ